MVLGSLEKLWETAVTAFTFPQFTIIVTLPLEDDEREVFRRHEAKSEGV